MIHREVAKVLMGEDTFVFKVIDHLRQICIHPQLLLKGRDALAVCGGEVNVQANEDINSPANVRARIYAMDPRRLIEESGKMQVLIRLIQSFINEHKCLVFRYAKFRNGVDGYLHISNEHDM